MAIELGSTGMLAKVTAVDENGSRIYIDIRNGNSGWFDDSSGDFEVDDVLLIVDSGVSKRAEKLPRSAWPEELLVGVVKIRLKDITVVDSAGRWRTVPTNDRPDYEVGNTVQVGATQGVVRVLSEKPIRYLDSQDSDEATADDFLWEPPEDGSLGFEDFGGFKDIVRRARELIEVPLKRHEELSKIGARSIKGVLFTGPPGSGKTMLARIIASHADAAFYEISGPTIFSKWYGESEKILRSLFSAASCKERAIIFIDEIDSVAGQRSDSSHEASIRVVAQLLTLMDGFASRSNVIVIAATNRPQDLDVALRRPGRFDWEISFRYPTSQERAEILERSARNLLIDGELCHDVVVENSDGWSSGRAGSHLDGGCSSSCRRWPKRN